jgi:uncharacterized membrane protein YbhN (UPF0104 family)
MGNTQISDRLYSRILFLVGVSGAAYLLVAVWAGWSEVIAALRSLGLAAAAAGVLASTANYLLRFSRWLVICRALEASVPWSFNLKAYVGGLALTATPGKIGETVRSALLLRYGVPVAASLAAFFVDRLADLTGVLLLAALTAPATIQWGYAAFALLAMALGFGVARLGVAISERLLRRFPNVPLLKKICAWTQKASIHVGEAWRIRLVPLLVAVAMAAYGLQAAVFAAYVQSLWPAIDSATAFHFFLVSTLVGAASMLPGGLGAMEASLIGLLVHEGMPLALATSATIGIRLVTLWFGIFIGVCSLSSLRKADPKPFDAGNPV